MTPKKLQIGKMYSLQHTGNGVGPSFIPECGWTIRWKSFNIPTCGFYRHHEVYKMQNNANMCQWFDGMMKNPNSIYHDYNLKHGTRFILLGCGCGPVFEDVSDQYIRMLVDGKYDCYESLFHISDSDFKLVKL